MALPSTHRWIALGNLIIRNDKRASPSAPKTTFDEVMDEAKSRLAEGKQYREYGADKSHLMWFSNFGTHNSFHLFLAENGDKNTTGVSFIDFETRESRDVPKADNEGGHFTAHVAIAKTPNEHGGHLILVERVPGIYLGSLKHHFTWLCNNERFSKAYTDEGGHERTAKPVFEIDGHQSSTIRDALKTGTLQDIEFIKTVKDHEDGLDEDPVIKEIVHKAKWDIKQKVSEAQARKVFGKMGVFFREKFRDREEDAHLFVRIKTDAGQLKRTEVMNVDEETLEQAFVHNERISDFKTPLEQRHDGLRSDVVEKILAIPERLNHKDEECDDA